MMKFSGGASISLSYRNVLVWILVVVVVLQVVVATMMTVASGWNWYWALPVAIASLLPGFWELSGPVVNDDGFSIGRSETLKWTEVERVERASDCWLVFLLRSGYTKVLLFEDWPEQKRGELLKELRDRQLFRNPDVGC